MYAHGVLQGFADKATRDVFDKVNSKAARTLPISLHALIRRKLHMLGAATDLRDLALPGLRLEILKGKQAGRHSIRVNDQYRVTFRWAAGQAHDVRCEDYH